ncbi:MAG: hypothetical protein R2823_04665 [Acidimicrobiia bacterium]
MTTDAQVADWAVADATIRRIGILVMASLVSGVVVGGVGGRIVMRISALAAPDHMLRRLTENGNRIGEFTLEGTIAIMIFVGGLMALVGTGIVVGSDPWLAWMGRFRVVGLALVVLAAGGAAGGFESIDFLILEPRALNVAMFVALHVLFAIGVVAIAAVLDARLPVEGERVMIFYMVALTPLTLGALATLAFFSLESFCGCEPQRGIAALFIVLWAATVVAFIAPATDRMPAWIVRFFRPTGYACLGLLTATGLWRTWEQIALIL